MAEREVSKIDDDTIMVKNTRLVEDIDVYKISELSDRLVRVQQQQDIDNEQREKEKAAIAAIIKEAADLGVVPHEEPEEV